MPARSPSLSTQILVIGGGATGLGIAWDASLRGFKVLVIEQGDLGMGTSGRFHGLLHSGGRYVLRDLQSASQCAQENRILKHLIPHAIEDTGGLFVSTPADPIDYPDKWLSACAATGVSAEELPPSEALKLEPALNPRISRSFRVLDAAIDSFELLHALERSIRRAGGRVWLRHALESFIMDGDRIAAAQIRNLQTEELRTVGAEIIVNAAGPWARRVAGLAGIDIPLSLGKGVMVAMAQRLADTVINRCKPPADGDIIVPIGTVCVLGTTDVQVDDPGDRAIGAEDVDLLLAEGDILIPGILDARPLRAWAGVRPLYAPPSESDASQRSLSRVHVLLDHAEIDGLGGFISVIGGKLTTFRLMSEETVDLIADRLDLSTTCQTRSTPLEPDSPSLFTVPSRLAALTKAQRTTGDKPRICCECELVSFNAVERALEESQSHELDDIRRDLRLGMGPCQAAFCAYRAGALVVRHTEEAAKDGGVSDFLDERWRGIRPLAWGQTLRAMEFTRRIYIENLGLLDLVDRK